MINLTTTKYMFYDTRLHDLKIKSCILLKPNRVFIKTQFNNIN